MPTITSLQNLHEKFLSTQDGKYEWKFEGFTGYTIHRGGKIIWAEAVGTMNHYQGLSALLRIASNPQVEMEQTEDTDEVPNIREDWSYVSYKLREQIRMTVRYFSLKPRKEELWLQKTDVLPVDLEDTQKTILQELKDPIKHFPDGMGMDADLMLWQLVVLEERGAVKIVEPQRVSILKKS
ncbi:MAG: hypothetical protein SGI98_10810 [Verrucomicrobiota bacterium]|nr:hypothetical protein [Verrucomicrobiota bacterium]